MAVAPVCLPGFVDLHVHFREPGFTEKEDIESGVRAAAAGGYGAVCMMPNTSPVIDCPSVLLDADRRGAGCGAAYGVHVFSASSMTLGQAGRELVDFDAMDGADTALQVITGHGICGITEDGLTLADEALMRQVCAAAVRLGLPVMDHAEPELETVCRDIRLADETGAHFHLQHISLAESVALIRSAKEDGAPVTCETAPHYFALTSADAAPSAKGALAKMNPPLRSERDRLAILEGLKDGTIDCIATDHAPHEVAAKEGSFEAAANGVIGLETAFPVSYTLLVKSGLITLEDLIRLMSTRPAEIIGLPAQALSGVVVELETPWTIEARAFYSKGRNTPFDGMSVFGRVIK